MKLDIHTKLHKNDKAQDNRSDNFQLSTLRTVDGKRPGN